MLVRRPKLVPDSCRGRSKLPLQRGKGIGGTKASTRTYRIWAGMCARHLGGIKGRWASYMWVGVYSKWRENYLEFIEDVGVCPGVEYTIDRIDSAGHYEPGNCRWADRLEQADNRITNIKLTFRGEVLNVEAMARRYGLRGDTLRRRLFKFNWPLEEALLTPVSSRRK